MAMIAVGDGFALEEARIRVESAAWSDPLVPAGYRLVFVRRGVFRARVGGTVMVADPAVAYVGGPGAEQSIAHRVGTEDVCTAVTFTPEFMGEITHEAAVPVGGDVAVAHRVLVARARAAADPFELAERTVRLVGGVLRARTAVPGGAVRQGTVAARHRLVEAARELIGEAGLREIAGRIGCSPYHLSRVFRDETGMTLTAYRSRIRALAALDAIEAGESDLAGLAAGLGFADHAHLTRTVRQVCGHTPRALRRLLAN
jgi:AraC-like DNA-binding protein